jgi:hypothetical protein
MRCHAEDKALVVSVKHHKVVEHDARGYKVNERRRARATPSALLLILPITS